MTATTKAATRYVWLTVGVVAGLTLWRLAWLLVDGTTLSTDEAQYWFWGQSFAFGAYSKPPLIGWLIRLTTEIAGQTVFGARMGAPLVHAATALVLFVLARRVAGPLVAAVAALSYITLPAVALGSILITTDTPLLFFAAVALLMQHRAAQGGMGWALALGLAVGFGFLSKYAMIYVVLGMGAAAAVSPDWRLSWRAALLAAAVAFAVLVPNLIWIAQHSFATVQHVADDAEWQGFRLFPLQALRFVAEQLAVMGPVLFLAWIVGLAGLRRMDRGQLALYLISALPLVVVIGQALFSRALANWGVTFVLGGVIVAGAVLARHRMVLALSLGSALLLSLALPVLVTVGTQWRMADGRLYLHRYTAQPDIMDWAVAQAAGSAGIIAERRDVLAGLVWAARGTGLPVFAQPGTGAPQNHWELLYRFDAGRTPGPVYLLALAGTPLAARCPGGTTQARTAGPGFVEGVDFVLIRVDDTRCLTGADNG